MEKNSIHLPRKFAKEVRFKLTKVIVRDVQRFQVLHPQVNRVAFKFAHSIMV